MLFDLSALSSVNPTAENKANQRSGDKPELPFDFVLGGAVADQKVAVNEGSEAADNQPSQLVSSNDGERLARALDQANNSQAQVSNSNDNSAINLLGQIQNRRNLVPNGSLSKESDAKIEQLTARLAHGQLSQRAPQNSATDTANPHGDLPVTPVDGQITAIKLENLLNENETIKLAVNKVTAQGDEVAIEATLEGNLSNKVKLTIAKSEFESLLKNSSSPTEGESAVDLNSSKRIPLDGFKNETPKLDELLAKLNLKELEVKTNPASTASQVSAKPVSKEVNVMLTTAGSAEVMVKGKLTMLENKNETKADRRLAPKGIDLTSAQNNRPNATVQNSQTGNNGRVTLQNQKGIAGETILTAVKVRPEAVDLFEKFIPKSGSAEVASDKNFASITSAESTQNGTQLVRSELPQVRFSLPTDIDQTLQPQGKSVTIDIHPEILGPVRLTAKMVNGELHARLIVDSAQVKGMVEHSLNQLADQLREAGIKVDQLDVNVAGSDVGGELFGRSVAWNRPKISARGLEAEEAAWLSNVTTSPGWSSEEYVRADGVNLFA